MPKKILLIFSLLISSLGLIAQGQDKSELEREREELQRELKEMQTAYSRVKERAAAHAKQYDITNIVPHYEKLYERFL